MHRPDGCWWTSLLRPIGWGLGVVALVGAVAWMVGDVATPTLDEPLTARRGALDIATTTSSTLPAGEPIKELPAPAALDIRNELDDVAAIRIEGAGPTAITVGRTDGPKVRATASGAMTIDVFDAGSSQVLVRQAQLRLLPDEMTTLVVRRDASGSVVLVAAP